MRVKTATPRARIPISVAPMGKVTKALIPYKRKNNNVHQPAKELGIFI